MWLLLIVLINPVPGFSNVHLLKPFPNAKDCETARVYIEQEMAIAYPGDTSYKIVCEFRGRFD